MADVRLCVGFSSACKQAREGGGLPGYEGRVMRGRCLRPFLPPGRVAALCAPSSLRTSCVSSTRWCAVWNTKTRSSL